MPYDSSVQATVRHDSRRQVSARLERRIHQELETAAETALGIMVELCAKDTGATAESGHIVWVTPTLVQVVFNGAALFLEYGTVNMAAQPFMTPGWAQVAPLLLQRLAIVTQGRVRSGSIPVSIR